MFCEPTFIHPLCQSAYYVPSFSLQVSGSGWIYFLRLVCNLQELFRHFRYVRSLLHTNSLVFVTIHNGPFWRSRLTLYNEQLRFYIYFSFLFPLLIVSTKIIGGMWNCLGKPPLSKLLQLTSVRWVLLTFFVALFEALLYQLIAPRDHSIVAYPIR